MKRFSSFMLLLTASLIITFNSYTQSHDPKTIVILGSSVASGWVTSYKEKYDFKNGYAYRLERALAGKGFEVVNKGVPGDDTKAALARFDNDVLSLDPDYVFIGLSMSNEGLETENPDSVYTSFETGMRRIIRKCEENNIKPVLGLCYANNAYTAQQYSYIRKMNIEMNNWGYPCVNFLGALENGRGHFPENTTFDPGHPNNRGHEELFLAFPEGFFESIEQGLDMPEKKEVSNPGKLGKKGHFSQLMYFPESLMHSFTVGFEFESAKQVKLIDIEGVDASLSFAVSKDCILVCNTSGERIELQELQKNTWNKLVVSHRYADAGTEIYLNGKIVGALKGAVEPAAFTWGGPDGKLVIKNIFVYRAALNADEIMAPGTIHASLDCYVPFENGSTENFALSTAEIITDPSIHSEMLVLSISRINDASLSRDQELKVEQKKVVDIDPGTLSQFAGKYEVAEGDYFEVKVEAGKIFFIDRGQQAEILPESENKFFIRYPGEITFTFNRNDAGTVISLTANFNGYILEGVKQ